MPGSAIQRPWRIQSKCQLHTARTGKDCSGGNPGGNLDKFRDRHLWNSSPGKPQAGPAGQLGPEHHAELPEVAPGWQPVQGVPGYGKSAGADSVRCDEYLQPSDTG